MFFIPMNKIQDIQKEEIDFWKIPKMKSLEQDQLLKF